MKTLTESRLEEELDRFSVEQRKIIYENVFAIELTQGCSIGCDFCGFEAERGVNGVIPFPVLERIADEMASLTNRVISRWNNVQSRNNPNHLTLYNTTEPLDYEWDYKNYFDCHKLFVERGFKLAVSSAIPDGKEELAIQNLDKINQISISHMNRDRLIPYFERLGVAIFVDLFHFYYAKYGSHDYYKKAPIQNMIPRVQGTIQKTLDKLRVKDPELPEIARFYDIRRDGNRLRCKVQRADTLFLFCGNSGPYPRSGKIADRDDTQVRSIGRAFHLDYEREYPFDPLAPFCNSHGVKFTPKGVYNLVSVNPSEDNRSGILVEKINPDNFHVVKMKNPYNLGNFRTISPFLYV